MDFFFHSVAQEIINDRPSWISRLLDTIVTEGAFIFDTYTFRRMNSTRINWATETAVTTVRDLKLVVLVWFSSQLQPSKCIKVDCY